MILDRSGNAINAYDDVVGAHAAMRVLVADDPSVADDLLLVAYDEAGQPLGTATVFADLPGMTTSVTQSRWMSQDLVAATIGFCAQNRYVGAVSQVIVGRHAAQA
jgi:hypothetical protein